MRIRAIHILAGIALAVMATGCAPQYTPTDYSGYFWPKPPEKNSDPVSRDTNPIP